MLTGREGSHKREVRSPEPADARGCGPCVLFTLLPSPSLDHSLDPPDSRPSSTSQVSMRFDEMAAVKMVQTAVGAVEQEPG